LQYGSRLVFDVNIMDRSVTVYDRDGGVIALEAGDTFSHPLVPWLVFDVAELFADLELPAGPSTGSG
jgi:hypothetical protein